MKLFKLSSLRLAAHETADIRIARSVRGDMALILRLILYGDDARVSNQWVYEYYGRLGLMGGEGTDIM